SHATPRVDIKISPTKASSSKPIARFKKRMKHGISLPFRLPGAAITEPCLLWAIAKTYGGYLQRYIFIYFMPSSTCPNYKKYACKTMSVLRKWYLPGNRTMQNRRAYNT